VRLLHESEDVARRRDMPTGEMVIKHSRIGVPFLCDGEDEIIPLSYAHEGDLVFTLVSNPGLAEELMFDIKKAVEVLSGLDATIPDGEWMNEFNALLLINEFTTPLHVIAKAREAAARIQGENQ